MVSRNGLIRRTESALQAPVTLVEFQANSRVDGEATLLNGLLSAATVAIEEACGKSLMEQTWELKVSGPVDGVIDLPKTPVISVDAITYLDGAEASQTLDVDDFALIGDEDRAWLQPKLGISWPNTVCRADAITVTFKSGFEDAASVPANLKQAIKMLAGHYYENREAVRDAERGGVIELPMGVEYLVGLSRRGWIA
jgi:uncharacterized phiE125 gp8 family phage protein